LIADLQEYYLGSTEKPFLSEQNIKRLFFGYMKKDGLFNHLKECHKNIGSVKTKAIFRLLAGMLDCNKSHQVDDIKKIWRSQQPSFVQECHLEILIKKDQGVKD
jgi:hypothetical protein